MANRFSSKDNVKRIELGEGDWVDIPSVLSTEDAEKIRASDADVDVAKAVIRDWNLTEGGAKVEITAESLRRLDIRVTKQIVKEVLALMSFPKAQSPGSETPSGAGRDATS